MAIVNPKLARFALDVQEAWTAICEKPEHDEFFNLFGNVNIKVYTGDGLTLEFYEEGIDFYPKEEA